MCDPVKPFCYQSFDLRQLVSRPPIAYCGPSALQEYFDAKSFRLRGDEPRVTECARLAVARSSPYLRHALTAPLGQQATSHARHTWLLAD
jgi:hypothetical protein